MTATPTTFEIFLVAIPGLEAALLAEVVAKGFSAARQVPGGVSFTGTWHDVWRANLELRGASKVLARVASFHASHLAQLDKRAHAITWSNVLLPDVAVRVEASCRRSKIYHSGAAAQRIATAISDSLNAKVSDDADVTVMARIEQDLVTISIDTSGDLLHKRGSKQAMAKAPMRETMASLFLAQCGYDGSEPVVDLMCGSGTFVIEAAEIAMGLPPGRNRNFACEKLKTFDPRAWDRMKAARAPSTSKNRFYGSDRDAGAIKAATANASRAGVSDIIHFRQIPVSEAQAPEGPPGLVIINPPYGTRIGDKKPLRDLHTSLGKVLRERFQGWRLGLVTSDSSLATATGIKLKKGPPVLHGGLRIYLFQCDRL
jgi:putative N6-adenine-specific DNA methylase